MASQAIGPAVPAYCTRALDTAMTSQGDITINPNGGEDYWWPPGCPAARRMPRSATLVGKILWCSTGPGLSWLEAYYVASNKKRSHWILWGEADPGDYGIPETRVPLAWCPQSRMARSQSARALLQAYWRSQAKGETEIFEYAYGGLLGEDEMWAMAYEVWPKDESDEPIELPAGIVYCDATCEALQIYLANCRGYIWPNGLMAEIERPGGQPVRLTDLAPYIDDDNRLCIEATDEASQTWHLIVR